MPKPGPSALKALLLKSRLPEGTAEIEGVGEILVRGLSRSEVIQMRKFKDDVEAAEAFILQRGTVDPAMTAAEVRQWREATPAGEMEAPVNRILELSGLLPDARKALEAPFLQQGVGQDVRVPAGEPPEDDGGEAPPDDA